MALSGPNVLNRLPPAPMLAMAGQPPAGDGWVVEPKFDGARCVSRIGAGGVELFSRQATNLSTYFPDVATGCAILGHRAAIFDGEIIVLDEDTRPNFQLLQRRLSTPRPRATLQRRLPARLIVFDVLHLDGRDLTREPYRERRESLQSLDLDAVTPELATSPAWFGLDGRDVLQAMVTAGMEGVVCNAVGSSYQAGRRSRQWIKTPYRRSGHFVVGGYIAPTGDTIGALLVGAHHATGDLIYCGTVSTGFSLRARRDLRSGLSRIGRDTSPFRSADLETNDPQVHWVEPLMVGRIEYPRVHRPASPPRLEGCR